MDKDIVVALISAIGGILVALTGKIPLEAGLSLRMRRLNDIPDIMGTTWAAEWCFEDGTLYVKDRITFEKWTKDNRFVGFGNVVHDGKEYQYTTDGEVAPNRTVVLNYKAERYPTEGNIGVACLELSTNAESLTGIWAGRASKTLPDGTRYPTVRGGKVTMQKTRGTGK